ncbi:unnamed protein product [marine sediment metagenome]|uniref:Serine dehydratase beta chain domain-containing protein n=1 Tax=marine sediment metagenome TaxID=412755 RepID=X1AQD3_9ZZZZ
MKISILNDVLGPILHGPSSSHTAASYSIGRLTNMLCENEIKEICITFDSKGSFAKTYKSQNGDVAFLSGIINLAVDDPNFLISKDVASEEGIKFTFESKNIPEADHPNILFVFDATESSKPDLLFTFNMTPQFPKKLDENILQIDVYLDYEHKTKDINYLKRDEDYNLTYLKEIKEMSNAELYKASFSLVLHIKSTNKPF